MRYFIILLLVLISSCRNENNAQVKNCEELNNKYMKHVNQHAIERNNIQAIDSTIFYLDKLITNCQKDDYDWSYTKVQFQIETLDYSGAIKTLAKIESKEERVANKYPLSGVLYIRIGEVEKGEELLKHVYQGYNKKIDKTDYEEIIYKSMLEAYFLDKTIASQELSKNIDRDKFQKFQLDVIDHVDNLLNSKLSALDVLYEYFNIKKPDPKIAFVILKETNNFNIKDIVHRLREEWNRTVDDSDSDEKNAVLIVDDYRASVALFEHPIPISDEDPSIIEHNAHVLVSIMNPKGKDDVETSLIANIVSSVLNYNKAIGVYFNNSYISKEDFFSEME